MGRREKGRKGEGAFSGRRDHGRGRRDGRRRLPGFTLLAALVAFSPLKAEGQLLECEIILSGLLGGCTAGPLPVTLEIPWMVSLQVEHPAIALTPPSPADYASGHRADSGPDLQLSSNDDWVVLVHSATPVWQRIGVEGRADKPASDLEIRLGGGGFLELGIVPRTLWQGAPGIGTTSSTEFRTRWSPAGDRPGNYALDVVFTILKDP